MRTQRGLSIIEVILAAFIFAVSSLILFRGFTANQRLSLANRDRTAAQLLMVNLLEEVKAHPFGLPEPGGWPDATPPPTDWRGGEWPKVQQIPVYVEGRPQRMLFFRQLQFEGSVVGRGAGFNYDIVTATISWRDPGKPALQSLTAKIGVRRR